MSECFYNSEEGEFIDFETLDDWRERDLAKDAKISRLREALGMYADLLCEHPNNEVCGRLNSNSCSGCAARRVLSKKETER